MPTPELQMVDPKDLRPGPIRHETLPPELLEHIRAVYDVTGPYLDTTLEQFEIGFMRDMHPESEVAVWCSITQPGLPTTNSTSVPNSCRMTRSGSWWVLWSPSRRD